MLRKCEDLILHHVKILSILKNAQVSHFSCNNPFPYKVLYSSIEATIIKAQLRWVGHVIRMKECRMQKRLMYRELQAGKRNQGRDQNCGIKTQSKSISSGATSIRENWRDMPWIDQNGEAWFTEQLPTSNGSMPETHCCQRETPQSSLGSDHNN